MFGAFCDSNLCLDPTTQFRGSNATFTFLLEPGEEIFKSTGLNKNHLRCEENYFSLGGGGYNKTNSK